MNTVIEPETVDDVLAVRSVVRRAFHHHQAVADMVDLIRAPAQYVPEPALVARTGREVHGFVMLSHAEVVEQDGTRHDVLTLSPLAVAPDHERQGIGSALVRAGLAAAEDVGVDIDLPQWAPPEAAQVYLLGAYDATLRGRLEYPSAFAAADVGAG